MDVLTEVFSRFCGQGRCFVIHGEALPVCQRCLGLYAGAAITGTWLGLSGIWRRGLPTPGLILLHAAMLLAAILGGVHVIDPGPTWRLLCGLWTGHVVVFWLVGAAVHLRIASKARPDTLFRAAARAEARGSDGVAASIPSSPMHGVEHAQRRRIRRVTPHTVAMIATVTVLAAAFPLLRGLGWHVWVAVIVAGAAMLVIAIAGAATAVTVWLGVGARRLSRLVRPSPPG